MNWEKVEGQGGEGIGRMQNSQKKIKVNVKNEEKKLPNS